MTNPTKAHSTDAGYDLKAETGYIVEQGEIVVHSTGVYGNVPPGHVGLVCSRSGLATREGVVVVNAPGIIDAGYTGEIKVGLTKLTPGEYHVGDGERIAQIVYVPLSGFTPGDSSERGSGGFGSSGR